MLVLLDLYKFLLLETVERLNGNFEDIQKTYIFSLDTNVTQSMIPFNIHLRIKNFFNSMERKLNQLYNKTCNLLCLADSDKTGHLI